MIDLIRELCLDDAGATALEYGLIAALVSLAAIAALLQLGSAFRHLHLRERADGFRGDIESLSSRRTLAIRLQDRGAFPARYCPARVVQPSRPLFCSPTFG